MKKKLSVVFLALVMVLGLAFAAQAADTLTSYKLEKGKSYSFENIGEIELEITGLHYVDYVLYYKDGSIKAYEAGEYLNPIAVPAGGVLQVTVVNNDTEATLDDAYFLMEEMEHVVMNRVTALKGETYCITNTSKVPYMLRDTYGYFDYVLYDTEGNLVEYADSGWLRDYSLPAGYSIKMTLTEYDSTTFCLLYDKFECEKQDTRVMKRVIIQKGETYRITNTSDADYKILSESGYFDYVLYDTEGNLVEYADGGWLSDYSLSAGYSVEATLVDYDSAVVALLYDKFEYEKLDVPTMKRLTMLKGETYRITNTSDADYKIQSESAYFDCALYDADGNLVEYDDSQWLNDYSLSAGYSMEVTLFNYDSSKIILLYDKFEYEKLDTPVIKRLTLNKGETYRITNCSDAEYRVMSASAYHDYVVYDADGNLVEHGAEQWLNDYSLSAGYSMEVTLANYDRSSFSLLYDKFEYEKLEEPTMLRVAGSVGDKITFENLTNRAHTLHGTGYVDYTLYYSNGAVKSKSSDVWLNDLEIPAGGKITLTISRDSATVCGLYDAFDLVDVESADNQYFYFGTGTSYMIKNGSDVDQTIGLNGGGTWDYMLFDAEGAYTSGGFNSTEAVTLPKGAKVYVTANNLAYNALVMADGLDILLHDTPIKTEVEALPGETYRFDNTGKRAWNVHLTGLAADYIIYNADDSIMEYGRNSTETTYEIPANGYLLIQSPYHAKYYFATEYFTYEAYSKDLFTKTAIGNGETYQFENTSPVDYNVFIDGGAYDYVIYNADDTVKTEEVCTKNWEILVPTGCKLVITPCVGEQIVHALESAFTVTSRSFPVFMRDYVDVDKATVFTNKSGMDKKIYAPRGALLDYATYDAGGNVQEAEEQTNVSVLTVPTKGNATLLAKLEGITFAGLYECFTTEDLTVKVTGVSLNKTSLTLALGKQSVLKATVLPEDATNKNVTWSSSDTSVVTVAQTGKLVAKSVGSAIITVTTADGNYSATCEVTVTDGSVTTVPVTGVSLNRDSVTLEIGETASLTATVTPSNATNKSVTWTSKDSSIVSVANGVLTAKSAGTTSVIVSTADGGYTAVCKVTVNKKEEGPDDPVDADAVFTFADVSGRPGDTVKVQVSLSSSKSINSIAVSGITYDNSVLEFVGFDDYAHLDAITMLPPAFDTNKMAVVIALKNASAYQGELFSLKFKIKEDVEDGTTKVTASSVTKLNSTVVSSAVDAAEVTVRSQILGDINGDEAVDVNDAVLLFQYSMLPDLYPVEYTGDMDFNHDGVVDVNDAVLLFQYSMLPDLYPIG